MGGIKVKVWGDYGLFSRPEMKVERVSYDVMTPSAARAILDSIYFKPEIKWVIDSITVLNPISFQSIMRNEILGKISMHKVKSVYQGNVDKGLYQSTKDVVQRNALILKNVAYVITAHFELVKPQSERNCPKKHFNIIKRRLRNGQCFQRPYLGCREFSAHFEESNGQEKSFYEGTEKDLGYMLWDIDYENDKQPLFFRPVMKNGTYSVPNLKGGI